MSARHGGEHRGSAADRRRRKLWLLSPEAGFGGNGRRVRCFWCPRWLSFRTVSADRFPICGHDGGSYARHNIVPACMPCNRRRCSCPILRRLHARRAA